LRDCNDLVRARRKTNVCVQETNLYEKNSRLRYSVGACSIRCGLRGLGQYQYNHDEHFHHLEPFREYFDDDYYSADNFHAGQYDAVKFECDEQFEYVEDGQQQYGKP